MQMIWMRNTNVINPLKGHHQSQVKLLKIKLFMKVVKKVIYVAMASFCLNLTVSSQNITLKMSNITVKQAMDELKSRSGYSFVFSSADVDTGKKVSVSAENQSVDAVIEQILRGQELTYEIRDKNVIIRKKTSSIKETSKKAIEVIGTVLDSKGVPIIGANVVIKGTTNGTISDFDGNFSIQNVPANAVLIVSYIGYVDKEIAVGDESVIKVILSEDMQALDEVVVVGYGTMKKSDLTGSISNVKSDKLLNRPVTNITQSLQGKVAGVEVFQNSGAPGGHVRMRIRGDNSIKSSNEPLYVVDGIIGVTSELLNPNDVESIEVLKDASATAIYGARGANGVVLVTTKRGLKGKPIVSYEGYMAIGTPAKKIDVLNSEEFMQVYNSLYENAKKYDPKGYEEGKYANRNLPSNYPNLFDANGKPLYDTDWQDEAYRTAISHNHQISMRGGTDNTTYGLFVSYKDENGIMLESGLKRYSGKITLDTKVKDWLTVGGMLSVNQVNENRVFTLTDTGAASRSVLETLPIIPVKYPDGTWGSNRDWPGTEDDNPVRLLKERSRLYYTTQSVGNIYLDFKIIKDLSLRSNIGIELINMKNNSYTGKGLRIATSQQGIASIEAQRQYYWQNENYFNYNKTFGKYHRLNAMLGLSWQQKYSERVQARHENFMDDFYQWHNLGVGTVVKPSSSNDYRWGLNSYFARVNYNYKEKYLLTVTGRYDGSSKFGKNNKYAFFPSAALAWRVSEESFLKSNDVISNLKIRASVGVTGNQEIGDYAFAQNMGTSNIILDNNYETGLYRNSFGNPDLKWEKTIQADAGFDLSLFNNRIEVIADYYHKTTKDLLLDAPIPYSSGLETVTKNIGSIRNQGLELTLNTHNVKNKNFNWYTNLSWSMNRNKVLKLGVNDEDIFPGPYQGGEITVLRVGKPIGAFWGKVRMGTWGESEIEEAKKYERLPGDLKYKDLNNDGKINNEDETIIGYSSPKWVMNFSNTFVYKNLDLTVDLRVVFGNKVFNRTKMTLENRSGIANSLASVLNCWSPQNQSSMIAERRPTTAYFDYMHDDYLVEDGSFVRGQNIMLGYTFPKSVVSKLRLQNLRIYASGQNVFCITKYSGYDPESTTYENTFAQGVDFFTYPKPRTFTFGVNLSF